MPNAEAAPSEQPGQKQELYADTHLNASRNLMELAEKYDGDLTIHSWNSPRLHGVAKNAMETTATAIENAESEEDLRQAMDDLVAIQDELVDSTSDASLRESFNKMFQDLIPYLRHLMQQKAGEEDTPGDSPTIH